jgi:hypothetical protein
MLLEEYWPDHTSLFHATEYKGCMGYKVCYIDISVQWTHIIGILPLCFIHLSSS